MKDEIMVSICCITYNHEKYIRETLEGFLMQKTNFKYEIIIHDDASTDNTANIIREYEQKYPNIIKPIYQKENQYSKGESPFLNTMQLTKGKYIALCEGDDYWTDERKLQLQFDYMEENKNCTFCFHNGYIYDDANKKNIRKFIPYSKEQEKYLTKDNKYNLGELALLNMVPTASYFFRNNIKFPSWVKQLVAEDIVVQLLTTYKGYAYYMNEKMCVYRVNTGISMTDKWNKDDRDKNTSKIIKRLEGCIYIYENINKESNYEYDEIIKGIIRNFKAHIIALKNKKELTKEEKEIIKELNIKEKIKYYFKRYFPKVYAILRKILRK